LCIVCVYTVPVPCVNHSGIIFTCVLSGGTVHVHPPGVYTRSCFTSPQESREPEEIIPCAASN
jgi:hypothetical protein